VIKFVNVIAVLIILSGLAARAAEPLPLPTSTPWTVEALSKTPTFEWLNEDSPAKSLTYRALPYKGKPTSAFASCASPTSFGIEPDKSGKFPTLYLVHGGGGRAFPTTSFHHRAAEEEQDPSVDAPRSRPNGPPHRGRRPARYNPKHYP